MVGSTAVTRRQRSNVTKVIHHKHRAMADEGADVIHKGWLKRVTPTEVKKKSFLSRQSGASKKRFFVLLRRYEESEQDECPFVCMYEKEPTDDMIDTPKGSLRLWPHYRVDKKHDAAGKSFVFEIHTPEDSMRLQADTEANMDLWVFYLQIQTKLRPDFPGYCFEVTPEESDPMRRIGAKGSKCLLHVSKWGLTLALKRTRSLLAQWPLKCIRIFESTETGEFSFEAGRSAPMGEAHYLFGTLRGEDGRIYDLLDAFTVDMQAERNDGTIDPNQPATEEEVIREYEKLRLATYGVLHPKTPPAPSTGTPAASMAVPVPVPPSRGDAVGYDHLHRGQEELARQHSERTPAVPSRTAGIPIRGNAGAPSPLPDSSGPPLPPRQEGLKQLQPQQQQQQQQQHHHPGSFQRSFSERGHSLERYGRSLESQDATPLYSEEEPYTSMTPGSSVGAGVIGSSSSSQETRARRSFTDSDLQRLSRGAEGFGNFMPADRLRRMLSGGPSGAGMSEYEAMALRLGHNPYQNAGMALPPNSYENTPLISPSPGDGSWPGFPNLAFVSSPPGAESRPPGVPRKYQPPSRLRSAAAASAAGQLDASLAGQRLSIKHTYFQYQFGQDPSSPVAGGYSFMRGGAGGGATGSHQYQEVNMYDSPKRGLRRSMSLDDFFRVRSLSVASSVASLPPDSALLGSLDLAATYAKAPGIPVWVKNRKLPSLPPPAGHSPELNAYCGSPKAVFPPTAAFGSPPAGYDEIRGNRRSFNNNNRGHAVLPPRDNHSQMSAPLMQRPDAPAAKRDVQQEEGYLEPIFKLKRSQSEGDILGMVIKSEASPTERVKAKKSHSTWRSKSRGFFATLRKRTGSIPDLLAEPSGDDSTAPRPSVATLVRQVQSNSDLLDQKPVLPSAEFRPPPMASPAAAAVKPASHFASPAPAPRKKRFDFPLKLFRQAGRSADKEDGRSPGGGREEEARGGAPPIPDTRSPAQKQPDSEDNPQRLPKVKDIVASDRMVSFVKVRQPGPQGQSPSPKAKHPVTAMPQSPPPPQAVSPTPQPSHPVDVPSSASPLEKAARERLKEVTNRPLPSPPQSSPQGTTDLSGRPVIKQFVPGTSRRPVVQEKGPKPNRSKRTPPPPPARDASTSLDRVSLRSSGSDASDRRGSAGMLRQRSFDADRSPVSSEAERRMSAGSASNSNGSLYENTSFGSSPDSSGRLSGVSFDRGSGGRSSLSEVRRGPPGGSGSLRSSRSNSNGSEYENTPRGSWASEAGTPPRCLSARHSGASWHGGPAVAKSSSFSEGDGARLSASISPRGSHHRHSNASTDRNSECGSLPAGDDGSHPALENDKGNTLWL